MKGGERLFKRRMKYGELLYKRATGELPEMESMKSAARQLRDVIRAGDEILDVGCGAGHYLYSLRKLLQESFTYTGVDNTPEFLDLARQAYAGIDGVDFINGDTYNLPLADKSKDVVMSCNLLLHLPQIQKPLAEFIRVARRFILIRTLIGKRSFIIQDVHAREGDEFNDVGEPIAYHLYNIYSEEYVRYTLKKLGAKKVEIYPDTDFIPENIVSGVHEYTDKDASDVTTMLGEYQVNGYILQPWAFVKIQL